MIVANLSGVQLQDVIVPTNTAEFKKLQQKAQATLPVLEVDSSTYLSDSFAIASFLAKSSGKTSLLGNSDFEQAEVVHWFDFIRSDIMSLSKLLQWQTFGLQSATQDDYNKAYNQFKENVKVVNKHLNGRKHLVGDDLTVADLYLVLALQEMMQIVMDGNFRNSINNVNTLFKTVVESPAFVDRMGTVKICKKQVLPTFDKK